MPVGAFRNWRSWTCMLGGMTTPISRHVTGSLQRPVTKRAASAALIDDGFAHSEVKSMHPQLDEQPHKKLDFGLMSRQTATLRTWFWIAHRSPTWSQHEGYLDTKMAKLVQLGSSEGASQTWVGSKATFDLGSDKTTWHSQRLCVSCNSWPVEGFVNSKQGSFRAFHLSDEGNWSGWYKRLQLAR